MAKPENITYQPGPGNSWSIRLEGQKPEEFQRNPFDPSRNFPEGFIKNLQTAVAQTRGELNPMSVGELRHLQRLNRQVSLLTDDYGRHMDPYTEIPRQIQLATELPRIVRALGISSKTRIENLNKSQLRALYLLFGQAELDSEEEE